MTCEHFHRLMGLYLYFRTRVLKCVHFKMFSKTVNRSLHYTIPQVIYDAIANFEVRRVTRPDIPNAVGKNV